MSPFMNSVTVLQSTINPSSNSHSRAPLRILRWCVYDVIYKIIHSSKCETKLIKHPMQYAMSAKSINKKKYYNILNYWVLTSIGHFIRCAHGHAAKEIRQVELGSMDKQYIRLQTEFSESIKQGRSDVGKVKILKVSLFRQSLATSLHYRKRKPCSSDGRSCSPKSWSIFFFS